MKIAAATLICSTMLFAYREAAGRLERLAPDADIAAAVWIDLWRPQPEQVSKVEALGVEIPTLADMEEIEISNRLYREGEADYMTVVLPGQTTEKTQVSGPVTFILTGPRLITVRHHSPRPFETFPDRAQRTAAVADERSQLLAPGTLGELGQGGYVGIVTACKQRAWNLAHQP